MMCSTISAPALRTATSSARRLAALLCWAPLLAIPGLVQAQAQGCDLTARHGAGPFDYRYEHQMLPIVELRHFTPKVEALLAGESTSRPAPDIDYTLNKFPNHHRALISLIKLGQKMKTHHVDGMRYSIECFFDRAVYFRADDTIVRVLYSQYLGGAGRQADAVRQLELAAKRAGDSGFSHFNIGMGFFDLKEYEPALQQAHEAMRLGFTRPELMDRLKSVGKWQDPPANAAESAASAASAPASAASQ